MSTRIATLWENEKDGRTYISGKMHNAFVMQFPANNPVTFSVSINPDHTPGDKKPFGYLEVWEPQTAQP